MTKDSPIPIKPMTLRGVFGITNTLVKRSFWSVVGYIIIYTLAVALLSTLCVLPVIAGIGKGDGFGIASGAISTTLLTLLFCLVAWLVLYPIINGTLYGEMSARMYGEGNSLGGLFKRSGFSLKRFFTLNLCQSLGIWVAGIVSSIVMGIVSSIVMMGGIFGLITKLGLSGNFEMSFYNEQEILSAMTSLIFPSIIVCIIGFGVGICTSVPLTFIYPVAVNENKKNFTALGRSISLGFKRFGRIFSAQLILGLVTVVAVIISAALMSGALVLAESIDGAKVLFVFIAIIFGLVTVFIAAVASAYMVALSTVLYFDAKAREDESAKAQAQAQPQPTAPYGSHVPCPGAPVYTAPIQQPYIMDSTPKEEEPMFVPIDQQGQNDSSDQ